MTEIKIKLPKPHEGQRRVRREAARFNVLECGRRFGKTTTGEILACESSIESKPVGWFAPTYKYLAEPWTDLSRMLQPAIKRQTKIEQRIELITGGVIDFWTLDNPDPGRGRKYARVIIDEAGITRDLQNQWQSAIRPTLTDLKGDAWFLGTPKGRNYFHQLFSLGESGETNWKSWRMGSHTNPHIPADEIEEARLEYEKRGIIHVFNQEYLGIPADDGGNPFGIKAINECATPSLSTNTPVAFGVDLAKSQDWTWVVGLDAEGAVCISERWQSDWGATQQRIKSIIGNTPSAIDSTGVGDPIVEQLQRACQDVEGFKFTSQSKQQIMEGLASAIQQRDIRIGDEQIINELCTFEYQYSKRGVRYEAPTGLHDDGVCALALAWYKYRDRRRADIPVSLVTVDNDGWNDRDDDHDEW